MVRFGFINPTVTASAAGLLQLSIGGSRNVQKDFQSAQNPTWTTGRCKVTPLLMGNFCY
jgi:hypothetical protein